MSRTYYHPDPKTYGYDYTNQAWVINGKYENCGHPERMASQCAIVCFGRIHKGEAVREGVSLH